MKVRHILVQHLYEAEDLYRRIKNTQDFENIARKHSLCPSSEQGGDLGDLSAKRDRLDIDFSEACDVLKIGVVSEPVRTRFGYHLILRYG